MSLTNVSLSSVVKKQYRFKLKSYISVFTSMVVLQILAIFFSLSGVGSSGGTLGENHVNITYYSSDMVIVFTMLWAFINGVIITTRAYREDDFAFVTNRLSSNLSNLAFLITASLIGAITAILSGFLLKVILYLAFQLEPTFPSVFFYSPMDFLVGLITTFLFVLLFGTIGYVIGSAVQLHKLFLFIIPLLLVGLPVPLARNGDNLLIMIGEFYFLEASFIMTVLKVLLSISIFFAFAVLLLNRKEVRK